MDVRTLLYGISGFLMPFIPRLLAPPAEKAAYEDEQAFLWAKDIMEKLKPKLKQRQSLKEAMQDAADNPSDPDAQAAFRLQLKKIIETDDVLAEELGRMWITMSGYGIAPDLDKELGQARWLDILNRHDDVLKRLEMVRLLRAGVTPEKIAADFHTDCKYLYRVHAAFSQNGVYGILSGSNIRCWLDYMNPDDPVVRRLEMIRLLRAGTPAETIAKEYNCIKEYVYRLNDRFTKHATTGILTEDDFQRYRALNPKTVRITSFNLHGTHGKDDAQRFKQIASELSANDPEICLYQEVINGAGIEETSAQIAGLMTKTTGYYYRTHYSYCHLFMDKYPEGVAVSSRYALKNPQTIDLNKGLTDGVRPLMERFSSASEVEIYGRRFVFASVHLDHSPEAIVRLAQAEKLLKSLDSIYGSGAYCTVIAGDFNDVEDSPVITYLMEHGFVDAYRSCHKTGGNTFPSQSPNTRIDYIMVRGGVKVHYAELILKDPSLSDHTGVYAVVE
ncbi:MAG: endonuclease/exonuclease/phosphatase family protein [Candidatus Magnetominusculus sp. LBB02]|nr:endonuclease/exonuclease/phosphatase family protein [Candidatus Magnetominusculus sp. LBB02]